MTDVLPSACGNSSKADTVDSLSLCCTCDTVDIYSTWATNGGCDCTYHDGPQGLTSSIMNLTGTLLGLAQGCAMPSKLHGKLSH